MHFNPGFSITVDTTTYDFGYKKDSFGPETEKRTLDSIRKSLMDPNCDGPEVVYTIAMDVGQNSDKQDLVNRNLLYGACIYAQGKIGNEPVRSQGHIHSVSKSCQSSTPEVYEIWAGSAIIYMQETAKDNPGRIFAVEANVGDVVIVPPGWAHYTCNSNEKELMAFGAWCVRDFGFDYDDVRSHGGLAYFPIYNEDEIEFIPNTNYQQNELVRKSPRKYSEFNITDEPIYTQYTKDNNKFRFVTNPDEFKELWENFTP